MKKRSILKTLASSLLILTLVCLICLSTEVEAKCKYNRLYDTVVYREPAYVYEVSSPDYYYYLGYPYYGYLGYFDYYDCDYVCDDCDYYFYNPYYYYSYYNPYYVVLDDYLNWFELYYPVYYSVNYDSILDFYYSRVCCYESFDWRYYWNNILLNWTPYTTVYTPVKTVESKVEKIETVPAKPISTSVSAANGSISLSTVIPQSLNAEAEIILYTNNSNEIIGTVLFRNKSTGEYVSYQDPITLVAAGFGSGQAQIAIGNDLYQVVSYQQNNGGNLQFVINSGTTFRVVK